MLKRITEMFQKVFYPSRQLRQEEAVRRIDDVNRLRNENVVMGRSAEEALRCMREEQRIYADIINYIEGGQGRADN